MRPSTPVSSRAPALTLRHKWSRHQIYILSMITMLLLNLPTTPTLKCQPPREKTIKEELDGSQRCARLCLLISSLIRANLRKCCSEDELDILPPSLARIERVDSMIVLGVNISYDLRVSAHRPSAAPAPCMPYVSASQPFLSRGTPFWNRSPDGTLHLWHLIYIQDLHMMYNMYYIIYTFLYTHLFVLNDKVTF